MYGPCCANFWVTWPSPKEKNFPEFYMTTCATWSPSQVDIDFVFPRKNLNWFLETVFLREFNWQLRQSNLVYTWTPTLWTDYIETRFSSLNCQYNFPKSPVSRTTLELIMKSYCLTEIIWCLLQKSCLRDLRMISQTVLQGSQRLLTRSESPMAMTKQ